MLATHYEQLEHLQRISFAHFSTHLKSLAMAPISSIDQRDKLIEFLIPLTDETLHELCIRLHLLMEQDTTSSIIPPHYQQNRQFLMMIIVTYYQRRISQKQQVKEMPLFPVEVS